MAIHRKPAGKNQSLQAALPGKQSALPVLEQEVQGQGIGLIPEVTPEKMPLSLSLAEDHLHPGWAGKGMHLKFFALSCDLGPGCTLIEFAPDFNAPCR